MNLNYLKNIISEWASQLPYTVKIYLYGSHANGSATNRSDIDLAFEFIEYSENKLLFWFENHTGWQDFLSKKLRIKVHLELYEEGSTDKVRTDPYILLFSSI